MGQNKQHKKCVQDTINRIKKTHLCQKEYPVFRNGDIHFLDAVGFPHKERTDLKPIAVECECGSSKPQQESNKMDLLEFKKRYPEAEVFQVNNAEQIDFNRLKKMQQRPVYKPIYRPIRRF